MKKQALLTAVVSALAASAIAGGIAWASIPDANKVFSACMLNGIGTIRLIDKSLPSTNLMGHCTDKETEISWNQKGQDGAPGAPGATGPTGPAGPAGKDGINGTNGTNGTSGKDGVSVTSVSEPAGSNCANGGTKFTAANGVTYACNGKDGTNGTDGAPGPQGNPGLFFRGEWSPFGDYLPGSVVTRDGSSWVNTTYACCGSEPGVSGDWNLLAAKGDQGPPVPDKQFTDRNTFYSATVHTSAQVTVANGVGEATVDCGQNEILAGGGYSKSGDPYLVITDSRPGGNGWYVRAFGQDGEKVTAYVVCLEPHLQITVQ